MKKLLIWRLGMLFFLLGSITGCDKPIEEKIIGKWKEALIFQYVEFFPDMTFSLDLIIDDIKNQNKMVNGKWIIMDDKRLKMDAILNGNLISLVHKIEFKDNTLLMTSSDEKTTIYMKVE